MAVLETARLRLRPWQEDDLSHVARFFSDADSARFVGGEKDLDESWRLIALHIGHWQLKGFGYWAVEEKSTNTFLGSVGLWQSPGWSELELGYWILKEHRRRDYAAEACARSIEFAREVLHAHSLVSYIDPANEPSLQVAKRLGARYDGSIELTSYGTHGVYRYF